MAALILNLGVVAHGDVGDDVDDNDGDVQVDLMHGLEQRMRRRARESCAKEVPIDQVLEGAMKRRCCFPVVSP